MMGGMTDERTFYSDANGIRIGASRVTFGSYTYATRNITGVSIVRDTPRRWPGIFMNFVGLGLAVYGVLTGATAFLMMGGVAMLGAFFNLSRKRPKYGVRLATPKGPAFVLASNNRAYVEQVEDAVRRALQAVATPGREAGA